MGNMGMQDKTKGLILMLLSAMSFAMMAAFVKLGGEDIPIFEKVLFRNLVSLMIAAYAVKRSGARLWGRRENQKFLGLRALFGIIGVVLYFYSINYMYLADSSMLNKLSPFVVTILAWLFLGEKINKWQWPSLIVVFLASLLIIKPKFDLSIIPALAGMGSAVTAGAAYAVVRYLGKVVRGKSREHPSTIVFYFSFLSVIAMIPLTIMNYRTPTATEVFYLIGTGVFAAGGQFGLTYAYRFAKATELAIYNYTNIIFSAIVGYIFWNEISDAYSLAGGAIIIAVAVTMFLYNKRQRD